MDKNKLTMRILVLVIALLLLVIAYAFAIRPAVTGYVTDKQIGAYNQGQIDLLNDVFVQLNQAGFAQYSLDENQVLVIQGQAKIVQPQPAQ